MFSSSADVNKFSMTARGVLRMIIPVAMSLAPFFSVDTTDLKTLFDSGTSLLDSLDTLVAAGLGAWASFEIVIGGIRKIAVGLGLYVIK